MRRAGGQPANAAGTVHRVATEELSRGTPEYVEAAPSDDEAASIAYHNNTGGFRWNWMGRPITR